MIVKASQRKGAIALAKHLLNDKENDHVYVHSLRGFVAEDLEGGLREIEALSKATRAQSFLLSVSFNPPENAKVSEDDFIAAADLAEQELGLANQPRALVIHEKQGRMHAHCVWSRIDAQEIKAIKLPYYKQRLNGISRDLYIEHGWDMPDGYKHSHSRDPRTYNLAEWQAAKRHQLNPKHIKAKLAHCWGRSDTKASFEHALAHEGFFLARGDRRGYVAVDWFGEVHSLSRATGIKTKDLKARLGAAKSLYNVEDIKARISAEQRTIHKRLRTEQARRHEAERRTIKQRKYAVVNTQRIEREKQTAFHKERQKEEQTKRQSEYHKGLKGLWFYVTGRYKKQKLQHEQAYQEGLGRDKEERKLLMQKQREEVSQLQKQIDIIKHRQQREIMSLNAQIFKKFHRIELRHNQHQKISLTHRLFNSQQTKQFKDSHPEQPQL
ncbi:relaxase/mobilization nuclease domain-containing protein [Aliiglaciecola aliphaticivorans]